MRYQSTRPKRQFLAGVRCPKCSAMDAVVQVQLFEPKADEYIECSQCGYIERRPKPEDIEQNSPAQDAMRTGTQGIVHFKP